MPVLSMSSGVVDVNYGERELKFLPEGYAPVAECLDRPYRLSDVELNERGRRAKELEKILANPDPSGALYVLSLLDKLDEAARGAGEAAAPDHPGASGSSTSGWRRASVEDYGRAMRLALEELAESDRREIERIRQEHDVIVEEIIGSSLPSKKAKYIRPP